MRISVPAFGSSALRAAAVAVLAGVAAACSNSVRLDQPGYTGSTPNQRAILAGASDQSTLASAPISAVSRTDLPPPPGDFPPSAATVNGAASAMPIAEGYAWTAVGGTVVTVGANETLDAVAIKYGVPPTQILAANQLSSAGDVRPGRVLVIPRRVGITPETAPRQIAQDYPSQPANLPATTTDRYVVRSGDTLYSIARLHNVSVDALAGANGLSTMQINIGQSLLLPAGTSAPRTVVAALPQPSPQTAPAAPQYAPPRPPGAVAANGPIIPAVPSIPVETVPSPTQAALTTPIDDADPPSANGTTFRWPVRGRIISGFGTKPNGERNDGINLSVPEGTSVKAVEAGTVIYAGNELEGYGNLILVRHVDGWVSAYAHNKDLLVQRGDEVRRGQTVAHAGMTGSVPAPQVHFELRKGSKPVNPLDYLTG